MYRELAPLVVEDPRDPTGRRSDQAVHDACERAIRRLSAERHTRGAARSPRGVARSLFEEIRPHFRMRDQLRVWRVIQRNVRLATEFKARFPSLAPLDEPQG
jgi:hypothetical protein